jgi:hypothetical protein
LRSSSLIIFSSYWKFNWSGTTYQYWIYQQKAIIFLWRKSTYRLTAVSPKIWVKSYSWPDEDLACRSSTTLPFAPMSTLLYVVGRILEWSIIRCHEKRIESFSLLGE